MVKGALEKISGKYVEASTALSGPGKYLCLECGCDVFLRKCENKKNHFVHNSSICNFGESDLHKFSKYKLKEILKSKKLIISRKCNKCELDNEFVIIKNDEETIEIEKSFIWNGNKKCDVCLVSNDTKIKTIFEICHTNKTKEEDRPEPWYEFDADEIFNANIDKEYVMLTCVRNLSCDSCELEILFEPHKENKILDTCLPCDDKGIIYFNQRGAGCGKTYESVQLINNFSEKNTFIYLTKMHSAKDVIYNEIKDQEKNGKLFMFENLKNAKDESVDKQYKITYLNKLNNKIITLLIGTIDSFNYAIVNDKITKCSDQFQRIVNDIRNDKFNYSGQIKYAKDYVPINKKCLIIIDEAQDLDKNYIEAFDKIISKTNIDVYVIGDKLQSIFNEHNIHTYIETSAMNNKIIKSDGINKVLRFHNFHFKTFVNSIVNFKKYGLPEIEEICDGNCKYIHNDTIPYVLFETPLFFYRKENCFKDLKDTIINYMNSDINEYGYLPKNFMFIFPIFKNNSFADYLAQYLEQFWLTKFAEKKYINDVLMKDEYWKNKKNAAGHVFLHKSEEGKSINLQESENMTRIVSVHTSKGNGCEVVFVLGISKESIKIFSKSDGLMYESFLHVSITRQKQKLYFGVEKNGDDIYNRMMKFGIIENTDYIPDLKNITRYTGDFIDYAKKNNEIFSAFTEKYYYLVKNDIKTKIIDWGHHVVRFSIIYYNILYNLNRNNKFTDDQFTTILNKLSNMTSYKLNIEEYYKKLKYITKLNNDRKSGKSQSEVSEIPVLKFNSYDTNMDNQHEKECHFLHNIIGKITEKISKNTYPNLCSFESLILNYMIQITKNTYYSNINCKTIYDIMRCYDSCSNQIPYDHSEKYNCLCNMYFKNGNISDNGSYIDIQKCIKNHYDDTQRVKVLCEKYENYLKTEIDDFEKIKYNINHLVYKSNDNFAISANFDIIAHTDKNVIYIKIKPELNSLNFYDVMTELIINNFVLLNCDNSELGKNNFSKFNGKKIYACIMSLNYDEPIFIDINFEKNNLTINNFIKSYLYDKFSQNHELIYKYYNYHSKFKDSTKSSFEFIENIIENNYKKIPKYVINFFHDINAMLISMKELSEKLSYIEENIKNKEKFILLLNDKLNEEIDKFLPKEKKKIDY